MSAGAALLSVAGLAVHYGAIQAVRGVDLEVQQGEAVAIVGPNGAGKTSLLSAIAGIVTPAAGSVAFEGRPLASVAVEDVMRMGIALVPEGRRIFASLTVEENLRLGATTRRDAGGIRQDLERLFEKFPILGQRRSQPAGQLSGGEQQQLAIARALMARPRLLMLDEPSLGLAPAIIDQVYVLLREICARGVTVLLVEQNAERAFAFADRAYVMNGGAFVMAGTGSDLAASEGFDAAYFGIRMERGTAAP